MRVSSFLLSKQNSEDFDGGVQTECICATPAREAGDTDAGAELGGEVEVAEDFFVEGEGSLVDCGGIAGC